MSEWQPIETAPHALRLLLRGPLEIWTECATGQLLLRLHHEGLCKYERKNATLGVFNITRKGRERIASR
jgi:hypothetical protein